MFASPRYVEAALADAEIEGQLVALDLVSSIGRSSFWVDRQFVIDNRLEVDALSGRVEIRGLEESFDVYANLEGMCGGCDAEYRQRRGIGRAMKSEEQGG